MRNTFVLNLANGYECLFFFMLESAPNIQQTEKSLRKTTELSQQEHMLLLSQTWVCLPKWAKSIYWHRVVVK